MVVRQETAVRFTRRFFLRSAATTVAVLLATADCQPPPKQPEQQLKDHLQDIIRPITSLMHNPAVSFRIIPTAAVEGIYGQPNTQANSIDIYVPPHESVPLQMMEITAFHEALHLFDRSHADDKTHPMLQEGKTKITLLGTSLYPLFREGNYIQEEKYKNIGHLDDNYGELFASSLTVLRFFPGEFLERIDRIKSEEEKRMIALHGLAAIEVLRVCGIRQVEPSALPFNPSLIARLSAIAQSFPSVACE